MRGPTHHATALKLDGQGLVLRGASGAGKSRLALRLLQERNVEIQTQPGLATLADTALISDDQVLLKPVDDGVQAQAVDVLAGQLEVRGLGVVGVPYCPHVTVALIVDLVQAAEWQRMPTTQSIEIVGRAVPHLEVPIGDLAHQSMLVHGGLQLLSSKSGGP